MQVIDDPNLYVIYVTRDPRDVIVSRHGKARICITRTLGFGVNHASARSLFGHDRFLNIRYEDFVSNPDATQSQITAKFPWLEKQHKFSEYHEHAQVSGQRLCVVRPLDRPVWCLAKTSRSHRPTAGNPRTAPDLVACGYESSPDWEVVLDGFYRIN